MLVWLTSFGFAQDAGNLAADRPPRYVDFPFDKWAAAPDHAPIKWQLRLLPPVLSVHQRLLENIQAVVPGTELLKRRGDGDLVLLARFQDSDGRQWHDAIRVDLTKIEPGIRTQELTFTLASFVRPGDYRLQIALVNTATMEHNFAHRTLHIAPLKGDALPQSWSGLPPVEILPALDVPESWTLPRVKDLLHLPLDNGVAPKIDLLVNITPTARFTGSPGALRRTMAVVLPAMKVLSAINSKTRPPSAALMDLTLHKIGFQMPNAASLDWVALDKALMGNNPGVIDLKALAGQSSMRQYLVDEVARRAGPPGPPHWLIVLGGPMNFSGQDEIRLPELTQDPNRHIVYFRFATGPGGGPIARSPGSDARIAPSQRVRGPVPGLGTVMPGPPGRGRGPRDSEFVDDMERLLSALGARTVPVTDAGSFRNALAALLREMAQNPPQTPAVN